MAQEGADLLVRFHAGRVARSGRRGAPGTAIGEGGDFVTSPHVSPAFAATLAPPLRGGCCRSSRARSDFVEVGAGDGRFLEDFAAALRRPTRGSGRLRLTAIEPSAASRRALAARSIVPRPRIFAASRSCRKVPSRARSSQRALRRAAGRAADRLGGRSAGAACSDRARSLRLDRPARASRRFAQHLARLASRSSPDQKGEIAPEAEPLLATSRARSAAAGSWRSTTAVRRASCITRSPGGRADWRCIAGRPPRGDPLGEPGGRET